MAALFSLNILTPSSTVFKAQVSSLVVPTPYGYLGVLAHHARLVSLVSRGPITVKDASGSAAVFHSAGGGFLDVGKNEATILLESLGPQ